MEELEKNIGYTFKNKELLKKALTHTSYAYEHGIESNEKLEFLGDSILEFISSEYIYENYSNLKEGEMTKVRATVVCESSLYKIAKKHNFNEYIYIGKSEKLSKGNEKPAILADSVEAIIAAMYIDGGIEAAKEFIIKNLKEEIKIATTHVGLKDYKTVLQEKLQKHGNIKITYKRISNQMVLLTFEDYLSKDSEIETMIVNNWFLDLQDGLENVDKYYYFYDKGIQIAKLIKEEKGFYYFENDVKKLIMQVSDSNEIEYLLNKNYAKTVTEVEDMINFLYLNRRLKHKRINVDEIKFFYREYTNFKIDFEKIDNEKTLVTISNITGSEAIVLKISDKIA